MRFSLAFLGLAAQVPLKNHIESPVKEMVDVTSKFAFKEGPDVFSPKDLVFNCFFPLDSTKRYLIVILRSNWDVLDKLSLTLREILH